MEQEKEMEHLGGKNSHILLWRFKTEVLNPFVKRAGSVTNVTLLGRGTCAIKWNAKYWRYRLYKGHRHTQLTIYIYIYFTQNTNKRS